MVVSPAPPTERAGAEPPQRTLAYQEKIARAADEAKPAVPQQKAETPKAPVPAAPAAPGKTEAAAPKAGADGPAPAPEPEQRSTDIAALPPDDGEASDPNALPWQHSGPPNVPPGMDGEAGPMPPPPGAYGDPSDPMAGLPGEEADPNAWPGGPDELQEWVQVLVSGVGMHGTPSPEAPMLFAFPYGRTLRVVSRYEGWVEVTDPKSAATGWMQAQYLAPVAAPGTPQEAEAMYDEEDPRWRRRWWRRHGGGFGDMINRALGGY